MKLKGYKAFEDKNTEGWYDDRYDKQDHDREDDNLYGRPVHHSKKIHGGYDPDEEEDVSSDDMDHLLYLIRAIFKGVGIHVEIERKGLDMQMYVAVAKKEKIKNLVNIFNTVKKIKSDILPQYDSEFQVWEVKGGECELVFGFFYDDGDGDDNAPF